VLRDLGPSWIHSLQLAQALSYIRNPDTIAGERLLSRPRSATWLMMPSMPKLIPIDSERLSCFQHIEKWIRESSCLVQGPQGAVWNARPLVSSELLLATWQKMCPHLSPPTGKELGQMLALSLDFQLTNHSLDQTLNVTKTAELAVSEWCQPKNVIPASGGPQ